LTYRASGVVLDNVTGLPIAGAQITLLDISGVSAVDGSFLVQGSRSDQCHFDYFYSFSVVAPGYVTFSNSGYGTGILFNYDIRLNPVSASGTHVVSGIVAEFPPCSGAMRGVTVVLEPLNLTTQTNVAEGRFAFTDVPPGNYTIRVVNGCNPFGCWNEQPVHVDANDLDFTICMTATGPTPSPTPTPTAGPSATFTVCPVRTPCVLGERPKFCEERCGIGCGCEACPACAPGEVPANGPNFCECVPENGGPTATPTRTPNLCLFPTPPLCPIGQTANCPHVPCGSTDAGCFCQTCPPCPEDQVYSGAFNSCECVDPRTFTLTPTPGNGDASPTPTPAFCVFPTPPLCPIGETPHCVSNECIVGCGCEPCDPCPPGLTYSGDINSCECVDPNAPTRTPTPTPYGCFPTEPVDCAVGEYASCGPDCGCTCLPCGDCPPGLEADLSSPGCNCVDPNMPSPTPTPTHVVHSPGTPSCPTRTPLSCAVGETTVCDTSVDPCGVCNCRAAPQEPADGDSSLSPNSSGGCAIGSPRDAAATLWSWSLLVIALALRRHLRRRHT
jgi:hypothetical protein